MKIIIRGDDAAGAVLIPANAGFLLFFSLPLGILLRLVVGRQTDILNGNGGIFKKGQDKGRLISTNRPNAR